MIYVFPAEVTKVYDGDTITVNVDLGFHVMLRKRSMRIDGIDTPELRSKNPLEKEAAKAVREVVRAVLPKEVMVQSYKLDKYGRILGSVYVKNPKDGIGPMLLFFNLAKRYDGGKRKTWTKKELTQVLACAGRMLPEAEQLREDWL